MGAGLIGWSLKTFRAEVSLLFWNNNVFIDSFAYVLLYVYSFFRRRSTSNVIENKKQEIVLKPTPLPYKPEFRKQATLTLITVDENTSRLINFNKLRDSPPPYEELEDISDSVSIPMPAATIGMCTKIAFAFY